jgi:hypothetical protein
VSKPNKTPGYGHQGLSVVAGVPHKDVDQELRDIYMSLNASISGSASGGFAEDSDSVFAAKNQSVSHGHIVVFGTIHQVLSGLLTYRVIADGHQGELLCGDTFGYGLPHSVKTAVIYPVGTRVAALRIGRSEFGVILGALTEPVLNYRLNFPAILSGIGTFHYMRRAYIRSVITHADLGLGLPNYSQGRPADLCSGDYSITNMLGGGFHTDAFQTSLRQAHDCGIWMFAFDRLLRFIGRSVQEFSSAHERYIGADEHETYGFEGIAMYPWEAHGFFHKPDTLYEKNEGNDFVFGDGVGFMEPKKSDAVPFYRIRRYTGFPAQGEIREVLIPPKDIKEGDVFTADSEQIPLCVGRQQVLSDGTFLLESAQAIHLVKHSNIRTFHRTHEIDDPQGDDAAGDYAFSESDAPKERPEQDGNITDQLLWSVRKQAGAAFSEHKKDFKEIPREQYPFEKDVQTGNLSDLKTADHVKDPPVTQLHIDNRYGEVPVSGSRASISILPGGGIALRGSCGEEILLQGGNITLSCPGDVRIMPARSVVSLAGDDVVLRAKNSIDLTATDNDVRVKAQRNLDMVGGMSGTGRTLLENKAESIPTNKDVRDREGENIGGHGLIFKADESMVGVFGKQIYVRSVQDGGIYLDGDEGKGNVKIRAKYLGVETIKNIELGAGTGTSLLTISPTSVTVSDSNAEMGSLRVFGSIYVHRRVIATDACNNNPTAKPIFDDEAVQIQKDNVLGFNERNGMEFNTRFYEEDRIGTEEAIKNYTFSYRTVEQCGASRFEFREPYWMELYGESACSVLVSWAEPVYKYQDKTDQLPWPGYRAWEEDESVIKNQTVLYNAETGIDVEQGGATGDKKDVPAKFFKVIDPH